MPKKIKFESFKYRFLGAAREARRPLTSEEQARWDDFVGSLQFSYEKGAVRVAWELGKPDSLAVPLTEPRFYSRGDDEQYTARQREAGFPGKEDPVKLMNAAYFGAMVKRVAKASGYVDLDGYRPDDDPRLAKERAFHDAWAGSEDASVIDVRLASEACTAPEMRYITGRLGDIRGKALLDLGCGLGEASVYFALSGARVTSADLSQGMLDVTCRLAAANGVGVTPHLAAAEDMRLPADAKFDIIYAGNLFHHVDIEQTLLRLKPHLAAGGLLVSWDPMAYNPAINVYRALASEVRTPDEHPLTRRDLKLFERHFGSVETRYFWLTTLIIFVIMALVQRRNPNKERFWKSVVVEGEAWRWLYAPLEALDRILLAVCPPLRLLCWNVVVVCRR